MTASANHIEPRITKLEVELASITRDISTLTHSISDLAAVVRLQADNFEVQFRQLHIGITSAQAPKRVDWTVVLTGAALMLAVGAASLSPIYNQQNTMAARIQEFADHFDDHRNLTLHPVGAEKVDALEKRLDRQFTSVEKRLTETETQGPIASREKIATLTARIERLETELAGLRKGK